MEVGRKRMRSIDKTKLTMCSLLSVADSTWKFIILFGLLFYLNFSIIKSFFKLKLKSSLRVL